MGASLHLSLRSAALLIALFAPQLAMAIPAFPGAEGCGAEAKGGRGGVVHEVTNLNASGPGSLREAVNASGPRTVVFRVGGTIALQDALVIRNDDITIAGQTAPGGGICLRDAALVVEADDVIVRYIRCRLGDESLRESDSISVNRGRRIVFDHCSASWSTDETFSVSTNENRLTDVTVQWCFITESLYDSIHLEGTHGYGSLLRGNRGSRYSFHHNLYAHHAGRSPRPGNYDNWNYMIDPEGFLLDFRNNVIYDFKGGHAGYNGDHESITKINYIGNYVLRGSQSAGDSVAYKEQSIHNKGYFSNNAMDGTIPTDPYSLVRYPLEYTPAIIAGYKQPAPFSVPSVLTDSPALAHERVLDFAGAIIPERDAVDARVVSEVRTRTGRIIDDEDEVGGWPALAPGTPPIDSDHDGMPDDWESARGLEPNNPADGTTDRNGDESTNLEEYLNWLARPTITFATEAITVEEGETLPLTVKRTGYTTSLLLAYLDVVGSATSGVDFDPVFPRAIVPVTKLQGTITLKTLPDDQVEGPETVTLRLQPHPDNYRLGDYPEVTVTILDKTVPPDPKSAIRVR
ncbi:MAG: hypothetical protein GHCLOJNM_02365 [bacterium]|nr:hypothetical protein [bacterium]